MEQRQMGQQQLVLIILGVVVVGIAVIVGVTLFMGRAPAVEVIRTYQLKPEALKATVSKLLPYEPLNLTVVKDYDGVIETDYEYYQGGERGLLWWKRRYLERAKYIFEVRGKYGTGDLAELQASAEVQERPNEKYDWKPAALSEHAKQRIADILKTIDSKLGRD